MILNNKSTNPIGYTLAPTISPEAAEKAKNGVFDPMASRGGRHLPVFPGVTGNHPKELLDSPAFKADIARGKESPNEGIEIISEDAQIDEARAKLLITEQVKLPDYDVVDFCTNKKGDEKKQIAAIESIFKIPTLKEIEKKEVRGAVSLAISRQFTSIETSIRKDARPR